MMFTRFITSNCAGRASALLLTLLTLLPPIATDRTTWPQCKHGWDGRGRVLELIQDEDATLLVLDKCRIKTLEPDAFNTTAPKLEEIHLSDNDIEIIDPAVFTPVRHITWLLLSHNKLREIPVFGAYSLFPNLQGLYLDQNRITSINDSRIFSACVKLEALYLDRNQIEYISPDVFKPLTNLESLHLSDNKITSISDSLFKINSLQTIWLDGNLIEYVSPNAFHKLRHLYLHSNRIGFLPSQFDSIFYEKTPGVRASSTSFYRNSWQCGCLLELMADLNRNGIEYARWEFNGKLLSCVYRDRLTCNRPAEGADTLDSKVAGTPHSVDGGILRSTHYFLL